MYKSYKNKLVLALLICSAFQAVAQKPFSVLITFPSSADLNNISINYDDGKTLIEEKIVQGNKAVQISGFSFLKYPVLTIYNRISERQDLWEQYYLRKKSSIYFYNNNKTGNFLDSAKLINAMNIRTMGQDAFDSFARFEIDQLKSFNLKHSYDQNESDSLQKISNTLYNNVREKKLEFIKTHSSLYYSLWFFYREYASPLEYDTDTLLNIYNNFSKEYKNSFEGREIFKILNGRANTVVNKMAPAFSAHDINGNSIILNNYRGKYVLLNFWASWCGSCLAEMPAIVAINNKYPKEKLEIMSVSYDNDSTKCINAIAKNKMNWINIVKDRDVRHRYGDSPGIPQVYLIDPNGKIIYSRTQSEDSDLSILTEFLKTKL